MSSITSKGNDAEQRAATFLQQHNLVLLEKNYRCRFGEIDLIMRDDDTVVFIEVRMRAIHIMEVPPPASRQPNSVN